MKKSVFSFLLTGAILMAGCEKSEDIITRKDTAYKQAEVHNALKKGNAEFVRQIYVLNEATSVAEWKGHSPTVSHHGAFSVYSRNIELVNGKIKAGSFTIPVASIQNFNLPDHIKPKLLEHLKSPDFFHIVMYPEATFTIKRVTPLPHPAGNAVAGANHLVTGYFTMIGTTQEISFPARVVSNAHMLEVEATFTIDRTRWGMNYAADPALGEHHIYPEVDIHLKLQANRL